MENSLDPDGTKNRLNLKNTIKAGSDATSSGHITGRRLAGAPKPSSEA